MRKYLSLVLATVFTFTMMNPTECRAEMPAKAKAFLTISAYGAGGGALLGAASMAFGSDSRAIAKGASLGLYAGIIFGAYVLISHHNRRYGAYEDNSSPYQESSDVYGDEYSPEDGGSGDGADTRGGFFDRVQPIEDTLGEDHSYTFASQNKMGGKIPPIKVNILQLSF